MHDAGLVDDDPGTGNCLEDHLTIETVSRTLTSMQENALIELAASRRVLLRNRAALEQLGH